MCLTAATSARPSLATEQTLALAMARHPSLGAESPAAPLDADTLQVILKFVRAAHAQLVSQKRLASICVRTGDLVDRVECHYSDGGFETFGGGGGEWRQPVTLKVGEYISGIGGRKGDSLDAIHFTTNQGRIIEFAGRLNGGSAFSMSIPARHELLHLSISARWTGWLRSVDNVATHESPWESGMAKLLLAHPNRAIFEPRNAGPFVHRVGALAAGHDLDVRLCTFAQAEELAAGLPNCAGFTFNSAAPRFEGVMTVHFKDRREGNNDWRWQTWLTAGWTGDDPAPTEWPGNAHVGPGYHQEDWGGEDDWEEDDEEEGEGGGRTGTRVGDPCALGRDACRHGGHWPLPPRATASWETPRGIHAPRHQGGALLTGRESLDTVVNFVF